MIDETNTKRRGILIGYAAAVLTGFTVICLAALGRIPPEPALGIVGLICGTIILATSAWRWSRRKDDAKPAGLSCDDRDLHEMHKG